MNVALYEITTPIAVLLVTTYERVRTRTCVAGIERGNGVRLMNCACVATVATTPQCMYNFMSHFMPSMPMLLRLYIPHLHRGIAPKVLFIIIIILP